MSQPTSHRTVLRDAILGAFQTRKHTESMRCPIYDAVPYFLTAEEVKRDVTHCVVVTDEAPTPSTMRDDDCVMTVLVVTYVRDDKDARTVLDAALEDAWETVLSVQSQLKETVWKVKLDEITTDDGTTIAKPYAQAVARWRATHRRAAVAA